MHRILVTEPTGHKVIYTGIVKAAAALGVSYEKIRRLAEEGAYTRNGYRVEYAPNKGNTKPRTQAVHLKIKLALAARLNNEAERRGVSRNRIGRELLEQAIVENLPPVPFED